VWLWPKLKPLFGFRALQVASVFQICSAATKLATGIMADKIFITLAGGCFLSAKLIFYTVRKEDQSQFTIDSLS